MAIRSQLLLSLLLSTLLSSGWAWAEPPAGSLVAAEGTVELGRGEAWVRLAVGEDLRTGDRVRTGPTARARIVLRDDSVIDVGESSVLVIDRQVIDVDESVFQTGLRLLEGKIRSLVSDYYGQPLSSFRVETMTAVSGVRGTEFIVAYSAETERTDVVGISGMVAVTSVTRPDAGEVSVTAGMIVSVSRGEPPSASRPLEDRLFRQYIEDLDFIAARPSGSLLVDPGTLSGADVSAEDQVGAVAPPAAARPSPAAVDPAEGSVPDDGRGSPGDIAGQPTPILERIGEIRVPF